MSTLRFSGEVTIRITIVDVPHGAHGIQYRCHLSRVENAGSQWERRVTTTQYVGAPRHLSEAIDSSKAFDDTAHAALSFASNRETAEDDPLGWGDVAAYKLDGSGWHVGRSKMKAWPTSPARPAQLQNESGEQ